jgi:hypothetical protein
MASRASRGRKQAKKGVQLTLMVVGMSHCFDPAFPPISPIVLVELGPGAVWALIDINIPAPHMYP